MQGINFCFSFLFAQVHVWEFLEVWRDNGVGGVEEEEEEKTEEDEGQRGGGGLRRRDMKEGMREGEVDSTPT